MATSPTESPLAQGEGEFEIYSIQLSLSNRKYDKLYIFVSKIVKIKNPIRPIYNASN